jgi:multidrug resistance protein, MATE family
MKINLFMLSSAAGVHCLLTLLFVKGFGWGFTGVCLASSLQFFTRFLVTTVLINKIESLKNTHGVKLFSRETIENTGHQFRIGMGSLFMGIWGWWAFDIFTLIASYEGVNIVSLQTIMRSLGLMTFMIPVGFAVASGILIGKNIGTGSQMLIKHYYKYCMVFALLVALVQNIFLFALRDQIIGIFTQDETIKDTISSAWIVFNCFVIFDTTQGIAASAIRATGLQKFGAIITFIAYFTIGIPTTLLCVHKVDMGIQGIWVGPTISTAFNTCAYLFLFQRIDWAGLI